MKCDTSRDEDFRASVGLLGLLLRDRGHLQGSNRYTWILMIAKSLQELDAAVTSVAKDMLSKCIAIE